MTLGSLPSTSIVLRSTQLHIVLALSTRMYTNTLSQCKWVQLWVRLGPRTQLCFDLQWIKDCVIKDSWLDFKFPDDWLQKLIGKCSILKKISVYVCSGVDCKSYRSFTKYSASCQRTTVTVINSIGKEFVYRFFRLCCIWSSLTIIGWQYISVLLYRNKNTDLARLFCKRLIAKI